MTEIDMTAANDVPEGAHEFFRIFSRFEYALKACGFAKANKGDVIGVKWQELAKELDEPFFDRVQDRGLAPTILAEPPQQQVKSKDGLGWHPEKPPASVQELFTAVCRIRNNLFHADKSGSPDHQRNSLLIAEARAILCEALRHHEKVCVEFNGVF